MGSAIGVVTMSKEFNATKFNIYMGDHLTRQWSKSEKDRPGKEDTLRKNNNVPGSKITPSFDVNHQPTDKPTSPVIHPCRSQYSVRKIANGKRKLKSGKEILLHHNITKDDMQEWQESFDSLLNSLAGRYVFKLFLESEIADENLKFWLACEDLKTAKSKKLKHRVQDIYDTYIDVYSPNEINIDYKMREDIVEQLKYKKDVSVFTEAQHQVYTLMHRDSYPRFLSSQFAAELIKVLDEREEKANKPLKNSKSETVSKPPSGIISCCYCRRQDTDADVDELMEEQGCGTVPGNSTKVVTDNCEVNKANLKDPRTSKTDSIIHHNDSSTASTPDHPGSVPLDLHSSLHASSTVSKETNMISVSKDVASTSKAPSTSEQADVLKLGNFSNVRPVVETIQEEKGEVKQDLA